MKNKKLYNIFTAIGAFILLLALCASGVMVFHSYYYELIYVSGGSMYPTLNKNYIDDKADTVGSVVDFGIVDAHQSALNHIERFDVVSTYYPESSDYYLETNTLRPGAKKKIKRVIALPNETFKIEKGFLYVLKDGDYEKISYPFKTNPEVDSGYEGKDTAQPITLKDDEYWVLGDNRAASNDCAAIGKPIKFENLIGVLVAIEGHGTLYAKRYVCDNCGSKYSVKGGNVCSKCGGALKIEYDVNNKQYKWPTFF